MTVPATELPPQRIPLCEAEPLAARLAELLEPACVRIEIAGSIRRQRPDVKDIELVCVPRMTEPAGLHPRLAFFDVGPDELVSAMDERVDSLCGAAAIDLRYLRAGKEACNGERQKRLVFHGIVVDLFILIPPADWGLMFTLRTGPSIWSKRLVTNKSRGGLLPDDLRVSGAQVLRSRDAIACKEERDFFALIGLPWIEPAQRTFEALCRLLRLQGRSPAPGASGRDRQRRD